jgi:hypothetical protein
MIEVSENATFREIRTRWRRLVQRRCQSRQLRICYSSGMIRNVFSALSLLFACVAGTCQLPAPTAISDFGYSSCSHSSCLFVPDDQHPKTYRQGNSSYTVTESGKFTLSRERKVIFSTNLKDLSASVSVVWSETSDWFAITWSDGGAIGSFHTRVFHLVGEKVNEAESVGIAYDDFRSRHWCRTRGDNVQAYGWDKDTGALVLLTSVYPTGDCGKDLGHTEAYLVQPVDGAILRHLSLSEFNVYAKSHPQ